MHILVNDTLITYITNVCFGATRGSANYMAEFDVDKDGVIDMKDIGWFSQRIGSYVDLSGSTPLEQALVPTLTGLGGLVAGFAIGSFIKK